jgi:hypothetical protein
MVKSSQRPTLEYWNIGMMGGPIEMGTMECWNIGIME